MTKNTKTAAPAQEKEFDAVERAAQVRKIYAEYSESVQELAIDNPDVMPQAVFLLALTRSAKEVNDTTAGQDGENVGVQIAKVGGLRDQVTLLAEAVEDLLSDIAEMYGPTAAIAYVGRIIGSLGAAYSKLPEDQQSDSVLTGLKGAGKGALRAMVEAEGANGEMLSLMAALSSGKEPSVGTGQ